MYSSTGLTKRRIADLCARIEARKLQPGMRRWPPILGLRDSLTVTLKYLRRNRVQEEIAEDYGVSQPTISRAISAITPLLVQALLEYVPTADDLDENAQYFVDGTLLPCWSWAGHPELYSGKHKTTGMNVQVACTIYGRLAWISDPVPGRRHDNHCLGQSEVLEPMDPRNWIADKGYVGNGMITPFKKPAGGELLDWQKEYNRQVNKIRYVIEQVIANFKTWRIMHTDYRRPIETFPTTISAVIGLHFYGMAE
jgi:DDE superfamily endonuclease/Helix-turn-helix of DDE superfamily endonuclease